MRTASVFSCLAMILVAAPSIAQEAASPAAQSARPYRINPGDELEVYVWGEERLQRNVKVLPDGTISFPLVGQVDALNKLPTDLEATITRGLARQYRDQVPQVTVSVRNAAGMTFSVSGRVKTQGTFSPGRYVNVLEALAMAGGPTEFADVGNVVILRKEAGRLTTIKARLTDLLRGNPNNRDLSGLPQIESGDTVIVP